MMELGAIYKLCLSVCLSVRLFLNCMRVHTGLVCFGHSARPPCASAASAVRSSVPTVQQRR